MGRGLNKMTDRQNDGHCVDFNIDYCMKTSDVHICGCLISSKNDLMGEKIVNSCSDLVNSF